ncbi:MAG: bifunctional DNA primase/polymerase [Planctomycetota bacterium]|jgi:hypothetical protein|nr:bifunctional DNA primase/polymerase [Planctomycetota bacterium]
MAGICAAMPIPRREMTGIEALNHFIEHGVELIPCYPSGASIAPWEGVPSPWTCDPAVIADLWHGRGDAAGRGWGTPIERFLFLPAAAGLVGLDIDRGHADGVDGLAQFYQLFGRGSLPAMLRNLEVGSFPCYTKTPRGGFHVLFKYSGPPLHPYRGILCPGVEVKTGRLGLTAPGSMKGGRPYVLFGNLGDAPPLPPFLAAAIAAKTAPRSLPSRRQRVAPWGRLGHRIPLERLAGEAINTAGGAHHFSQLNFASRAKRCGYDADDVLAHVAANPDTFGTGRDTESTIFSIYR